MYNYVLCVSFYVYNGIYTQILILLSPQCDRITLIYVSVSQNKYGDQTEVYTAPHNPYASYHTIIILAPFGTCL